MSTPMKIKTITLSLKQQQLEKSPTSGFYVVNRSSPRGHLNFNARDEFGNLKTIQVPGVGFPIDLSVSIPATNLLESTELRNLLSKGYVALVSDEEAARIFEENPSIAKARDRVLGRVNVDPDESVQEIALNPDEDKQQSTIDPRTAYTRAYRIVEEEKDSVSSAEEMLSDCIDSLRPEELAWLIENLQNQDLKVMAMTAVETPAE